MGSPGPRYEAGPSSQIRSWRLSTFGVETDVSIMIDSSALDAGATPTTLLRGGLLLGRISASGRYKEYTPAAMDGTETAIGILVENIFLLDAASVVQHTPAVIATTAEVDEGNLLLFDAAAKADFELDTYPGKIILRSSTSVP